MNNKEVLASCFSISFKKCFGPLLLTFILISSNNLSYGQKQSIDGDTSIEHYNLFQPIPKKELKEMETDRPDVTESAYTVAPGHFQVETDLYKFISNKSKMIKHASHVFNLGNYKLGLNDRADIQFVIPTYTINIIRDSKTNQIIDKTSGFDDIMLRFKYNIWGNDGGRTAFAILPFISFPSSTFSRNGIQGGVIFPFALKINDNLDMGTQAEIDIVKQDDQHYHPDLIYTITFGKTFSSKISTFAEVVTTYSSYFKNSEFYINGGIIYSFSVNFNLDAGFNYGLTKSSDKIFFTGFSFRL